MRPIKLAVILFLALAGVIPANAQPLATLSGEDELQVDLTLQSLTAMQVHEVETVHQSSHGEQSGKYKGVLLWDVIAAETALDDDIKSALRKVVMVTARDGHQVAFSIGEIVPDFGNRPVMIGYELEDQPIPDGLRMVSPGDLRGARYVKDVVSLEIR